MKHNIEDTIQIYYPKQLSKYIKEGYVQALPKFLDGGENTDAVIFGKVQDLFGYTKGGLWATNRRLLFVSQHFLGNGIVDFSYEKIERIGFIQTWPRMITFNFTGSGHFSLSFVDNEIAQSFANLVRSKLNSKPDDDSYVDQKQPNDFLDELERLVILKNDGFLSEDEFIIAKKKLLDS